MLLTACYGQRALTDDDLRQHDVSSETYGRGQVWYCNFLLHLLNNDFNPGSLCIGLRFLFVSSDPCINGQI